MAEEEEIEEALSEHESETDTMRLIDDMEEIVDPGNTMQQMATTEQTQQMGPIKPSTEPLETREEETDESRDIAFFTLKALATIFAVYIFIVYSLSSPPSTLSESMHHNL